MRVGRWVASVAAFSMVFLTVSAAGGDGPPPSSGPLHASQGAGPVIQNETGSDPTSAFFVQRNKNSKEVHYGIRLDASCRPVGEEPVYNYWVRFSATGRVTEPVTFFQQTGYGLKSQKVSGMQVQIVLKALPDRPILIVPSSSQGGCRVVAYMEIAAVRSRFEKAYVFAEEGLVLPTVKYIDLFGRAEDGAPVREHLVVD